MRSPRAVIYEKIRAYQPRQRYLDLAARLRVYQRDGDGNAQPGELIERVFGGRWDVLAKRYVGEPENWAELSCHPGQVPVLLYDKPGVRRLLVLGAPGGGKTDTLVLCGICCALDHPGWQIGLIAPTQPRRQILWDKFLRITSPHNWVQHVRWSDNWITLRNTAKIRFLSTKRQSGSQASPIAGLDLHAAFEDEQQDMADDDLHEVDYRGRVNKDFRVISSATNEMRVYFQQRVQEYKTRPERDLIRVRGDQNVFTPLEHWEAMKQTMPPDEYERKVLGLDVASPNAVYPQFSLDETIQPLPQVGVRDVTAEITRSKYDPNGDGWPLIVGSDFGVLTTVSTVYRVFMRNGERLWWAIDEVITKNRPAEYHVDELLEKYPAVENERGVELAPFLMISMPHVNAGQAGQTEQHDFNQVKRAGVRIVKASPKKISRKHRFSMVNTMLFAADGRRRYFIDCDASRRPACPKKVESFIALEYGADGNPNDFKKNERDLTHYTDTDGYAMFPWEKFRGTGAVRVAGARVRRGSA